MDKPQHRLSSIDPVNRSATCAVCGAVSIRRHRERWRCNRKDRKARSVWSKFADYKRASKEAHPFKSSECQRCGFVAEHPCQLDTHHTDGNHYNNDPGNVATLCACCHRLTHYCEQNGVGLPAFSKNFPGGCEGFPTPALAW